MSGGQLYAMQTSVDRLARDDAAVGFRLASNASEKAVVARDYLERVAASEAELAFLVVSMREGDSADDAQGDLIGLLSKVVERLRPLARGAEVNVEKVVTMTFMRRIRELPSPTIVGGRA